MHVDDVKQRKQVTKFVVLFHVWKVYKQAKPNYIFCGSNTYLSSSNIQKIKETILV